MFDKNYATKQDLIDFAKTIGDSFSVLKKEIAEKAKTPKESMLADDFILMSSLFYFGAKDPQKEQKINAELTELMKRNGIMGIMAQLHKKF